MITREKNLEITVSTEEAKITEPSILFKIGSYYHPDLSSSQLYDVSRGYWKSGKKKEKAQLAFTIVNNQIVEIYEIDQWFQAGTTLSTHPDEPDPKRWEFVGNIAPPEIRDKYINKSVAKYFEAGGMWPFRYINI